MNANRPTAVANDSLSTVTDFDSSPSYLICALANKITVMAARNLRRDLGLSLMEWRVMAILAAEPGATPGRVISFTGVNKSVVSRAVNSLVKRALVVREAAPDHGLRTHLDLTAAGREVHDKGIGSRLLAEAQLLAGLSPEDSAQLIHNLRRLNGNLGGA